VLDVSRMSDTTQLNPAWIPAPFEVSGLWQLPSGLTIPRANEVMLLEVDKMAHGKKCELKQFSYNSKSGMAQYWAKEIE